ncbi:MAG: flagellar hook basal-body protein [Pseudomonadota bacterium]
MPKSIYTAMSGAVARLRQLDQASHNLANVQTVGFRQTRLAFDQVRAGMPGSLRNQPALPMSPRNLPADTVYTATQRQRVSTRAGAVTRTDNPLDVALHGDGFLVLEGQPVTLTRDGRLHLDDQGNLRHASGLAVQVTRDGAAGPLRVDPGAPLLIDAQGRVCSAGRVLGQLQIATVADPGQLAMHGAGVYSANAGQPLILASETLVEAGAVEESNADPLGSLIELIAAQRGFELAERVLQVAVDLDRKASSDVGQVKS